MVHIDDYEFGKIVIDGEEYTEDLIIYPDHVEEEWWRKEGHSLHKEDIEEIIENPPDVFIVGKGNHGRLRMLPETRRALENQGTEVKVKKTQRAVRVFNEQIEEGADVVAALHLTC